MNSDRTIDQTGGWDQSPSVAAVAVADILARQESEWDRGICPRVEELLVSHPTLADNANAVLELVCNEVVLREERGEPASLAEYQGRFPELAEALRVQWDVDRALFSRRRSGATPGGGSPGTVAQTPDQRAHVAARAPAARGRVAARTIGRYRIEGILGKGGMGVAYRAWDPDLKRVVAVKTLRVADADDSEIARFRTESEAIARVRHPNIVQVFDVGEEAGQPFFAMEFCAGGSLSGRLKGSLLTSEEAAGVVEQIARGVEAAHKQNIIHRDLKPANVLLSHDPAARAAGNSTAVAAATVGSNPTGTSATPTPESVVYKVTDFGLAKTLDTDDGQTRTGAVLGTPCYMSPEQAAGHGSKAGPATDVYALGAILYECLTGRPPFQGATVTDTLDQVRTREPVAIRQLQPKVPVDLETIALKCLQKEVGKRYASAGDMADDLVRYLERRPIVARPVGSVQRAWRWCRRNPVVAGLLAGVLFTFAVGLTTTTIEWRRANAKQKEAEKNFAESQKNFAEAEENLRETFRAVNQSFVAIGNDRLLAEPGMVELRVQLLSASRPYFESFVAKRRGDPKWKHELARALARLASLSQLLEAAGPALEKWREAVGAFEAILRDDPNSAEDRYELALCLVSIGYQEFRIDQHLNAERSFNAALENFRSLPDRATRGDILLAAEANALSHLGHVARLKGNAAGASEYHQEAVRVLNSRAGASTPAARLELGQVLFMRGKTLMETGDTDAGILELVKAVNIFETIAAVPGREQLVARRNLAATNSVLGIAQSMSGIGPRAEALATGAKTLLRARGQWDLLAKQFPNLLSYQTGLAECEYELAKLLLAANKADDAERWAKVSLDRRVLLFPRHPRDHKFLLDLADSYHQVTLVQLHRLKLAMNETQEEQLAPALLDAAGKELDFLEKYATVADYPAKVRARIPNFSSMRARILTDLKRYDESRKEWDRAITFAAPAERDAFVKERQAVPENPKK